MISIIGVLATLILVGLRSTRNRARDVQIKSDITALNRAIVSYGAEHGDRYPISNCDQLDNNCDIRTVHSPAYGIEEVLSDTAYTGLKLIDGQYLNSVPVNKVNNSSYIYISKGNFFEVKSTLSTGDFFKFLTDSSNPDPISKIAKNKLGETQKIFSGMPGGIGSIILYPVWRSDQLAMWIDESGIVVTGSKVNLTKINWMPAYSINPPLKYKIYYKKNGDSSWLQGSDYVYTTQTSLAVQLDIADRWDFKIVAIDEGGIDSSQGTNPTLMDVNFSEDQLPIGGGGNPVKFYVCTNDGVNQGSLCSSDPPDRPDMVYIKTDVIFDPDQIDGISV